METTHRNPLAGWLLVLALAALQTFAGTTALAKGERSKRSIDAKVFADIGGTFSDDGQSWTMRDPVLPRPEQQRHRKPLPSSCGTRVPWA